MPDKKPMPPEQKERTKCSACQKKLEGKGTYSCGMCRKKGLCEPCYVKHKCKK